MEKKDKKLDEKLLEQRLLEIISYRETSADKSGEITKNEQVAAMTSLLFFKTAKILRTYLIIMAVTLIVLTASLIAFTIFLAFVFGFI